MRALLWQLGDPVCVSSMTKSRVADLAITWLAAITRRLSLYSSMIRMFRHKANNEMGAHADHSEPGQPRRLPGFSIQPADR